MLQHQFSLHLVLLMIVGGVYIGLMVKRAKHDADPIAGKKPIAIAVTGWILFVLSVISYFLGLYSTSILAHPLNMIEAPITATAIIRPSRSFLFWGYPTPMQAHAIALLNVAFAFMACAAYCISFKRSNTSLWQKITKFVIGLLVFILFFSTTDFHYFDFPEFIPLILYVILLWAYTKKWLRGKPKTEESSVSNDAASTEAYAITNPKESQSTTPAEQDDFKYMPPAYRPIVQEEIEPEPEEKTPEEQDASAPHFCRHCGKSVEYENATYCKYCGKQLF